MSARGQSILKNLVSLRVHEPTQTQGRRAAAPAVTAPAPGGPRRARSRPRIQVLEQGEGRIRFLLPWNGRPVDEAVRALSDFGCVISVAREELSRRVDLRYNAGTDQDAILDLIAQCAIRDSLRP